MSETIICPNCGKEGTAPEDFIMFEMVTTYADDLNPVFKCRLQNGDGCKHVFSPKVRP